MKTEFEVLKGRARISVALTRDSLCLGDDCDAPHEKSVEVYSFLDPVVFVQTISSGYLPVGSGSAHTWKCVLNGVWIAEISGAGIRALVQATPFADENKVDFRL